MTQTPRREESSSWPFEFFVDDSIFFEAFAADLGSYEKEALEGEVGSTILVYFLKFPLVATLQA